MLFLRHAGEVLSRTRIYEQVWDERYDGLSNTLEVHVMELRSAIDTLRAVNHLAPIGWTDVTPSPEITTVESFYISDLRAALTATYRAVNIAAPQFTDPDIIPGVTVIKAAHLNELREAVRNLE